MRDQQWFELREIRRRRLNAAARIPLRATHHIEEIGRYGELGHVFDYFGAGSVAIPLASKGVVEAPEWHDIGIGRSHRPQIDDGVYLPADVHPLGKPGHFGLNLVLEQRTNSAEHKDWLLHQDLVLGLDLIREKDVWLAANEGYLEVAWLRRDESGDPVLLEIRAEHLKDYLRAREMALFVSSYRDRREVAAERPPITWEGGRVEEQDGSDRWVGQIVEMHEGGQERIEVFEVTRTDVDPDTDVPDLNDLDPDKVASKTYTIEPKGDRVFLVRGELWRTEWVDPADQSPRVRGDVVPPTSSFVMDSEGRREDRTTLGDSSKWLWFRPQVIMLLANRRGGSLGWHTRDTGVVRCSPGDSVVFGVNRIGLINVFAKDIALLPDWQQREWAGHNVGPDGGVSEELLASQARGEPANTLPPEAFLLRALHDLAAASRTALGASIVRESKHLQEIVEKCHRFRAVDSAGLLALAKDLHRITVDNFDIAALKRLVGTQEAERLGSLKCLERILAKKVDPGEARTLLTPLAGINELRIADAHLKGAEWKDALKLVGIDETQPGVHQGHQLIDACLVSLIKLIRVFSAWDKVKAKQ